MLDFLANQIIVFENLRPVDVPHCLRKRNHMQAGEIWHSEVQCVMRSFSQSVRFFILIMYLDMLHSNAFWIRNVSRLMLHSAEVRQRQKDVCLCSNYISVAVETQWITIAQLLIVIAICLFFRPASCLNYRNLYSL